MEKQIKSFDEFINEGWFNKKKELPHPEKDLGDDISLSSLITNYLRIDDLDGLHDFLLELINQNDDIMQMLDEFSKEAERRNLNSRTPSKNIKIDRVIDRVVKNSMYTSPRQQYIKIPLLSFEKLKKGADSIILTIYLELPVYYKDGDYWRTTYKKIDIKDRTIMINAFFKKDLNKSTGNFYIEPIPLIEWDEHNLWNKFPTLEEEKKIKRLKDEEPADGYGMDMSFRGGV